MALQADGRRGSGVPGLEGRAVFLDVVAKDIDDEVGGSATSGQDTYHGARSAAGGGAIGNIHTGREVD